MNKAIPAASILIAVPEIVWFAFKWIDANPCSIPKIEVANPTMIIIGSCIHPFSTPTYLFIIAYINVPKIIKPLIAIFTTPPFSEK